MSFNIKTLCIFIIYITTTTLTSIRNGQTKDIPRFTYTEMIELSQQTSREYLMFPFIITLSPMSNWTIIDNLYKVFPDDYTINTRAQTANCSCFGNDSNSEAICQEFISTFLYSKKDESYDYWERFGFNYQKHNKYAQYKSCIQSQIQTFKVSDLSDTFYSISGHNNDNKTCPKNKNIDNNHNRQNYTKAYTYLNILSMVRAEATIDHIQLNIFQHIQIYKYFDIFDIIGGFYSIENMYFWWGNEYYRAIRHYDKSRTMFFVLSGNKRFRLSPPSFNTYTMHPFNHKANRQQYPIYSILANNSYSSIDAKNDLQYEIWESLLTENEVLYMPPYWFHEVINDNFSFSFSLWFKSGIADLCKDVIYYKLPLNPFKIDDPFLIKDFYYFIYNIIDVFCYEIDKYNHNDPKLRCFEYNNNGYGYILSNFKALYPIFGQINYDNCDWIFASIDIGNMLKCTKITFKNLFEFKYELFKCFDIHNEELKYEWDGSIHDLMDMLMRIADYDTKIAEGTLIEYIEHVLVDMFGSTLAPVITSMMLL